MKTVSRLQGLCWVAAVAFGFASVGGPVAANAESTLQEIQKRGKFLAGVRFSNPPSGYVDAQGNIVGFAPDLARELANHLGVEVEFVQVTSKNRIPLLLNGQIDADIGTTTPTKTRDEVIDFTHVYVVDQTAILVRKDGSLDPKDYFNSDKIVGAMQGSFYIELWKQHSPGANIKEYQELPELVVALAQGKIDAVPSPRVQAHQIIAQMGEQASNITVGGTFFEDPMAIGVRENDSDWRDWLNWALERMWADGTYQALYRKHYKIDPPFSLGNAGRLAPGYDKIAKENDPW